MVSEYTTLYPEADVMVLTKLREFARKLLILRPNARTKLEILRELLDYMKRPNVLQEVVYLIVTRLFIFT